MMKPHPLFYSLSLATALLLVGCSDDDVPAKSAAAIHQGSGANKSIVRRDDRKVLLEVAGLGDIHDSTKKSDRHYLNPVLIDFGQKTVSTDPEAIKDYYTAKMRRILKTQPLDPKQSLARLKKRTQLTEVYLLQKPGEKVSEVILPITGKGYFSLLKGYLAVNLDNLHIEKIAFYKHGETPTLGGSVSG